MEIKHPSHPPHAPVSIGPGRPSARIIPLPTSKVATRGSTQVRVRYCECDPMGVAHHAAYIPWLEVARTELLRGSGVSYVALEAAGVFLVIVKLEVRYRAPILYDDLVDVNAVVRGTSRIKIEHEYELVLRERDPSAARSTSPGTTLAAASTTLACVDRTGRPSALPAWFGG